MTAKTKRYIVNGVAIAGAVLIIADAVFASAVLGQIWMAWAVVIALALVSGTTLWHFWAKYSGRSGFLWNYFLNTVVAVGVLGFICFGVNYLADREESEHEVSGVVADKYIKKQKTRRRSGRRTYLTDETTSVYHMVYRLEGGGEVDRTVSAGSYATVQRGDSAMFTVASGFFGMPVVKF